MSVALLVLARDEAADLPALLDSVAGAVDRVVLVDTGSADAGPALAAARGATVLHHRWTDDFAAARNAGLQCIHEDWVLVLDADERLGPGAAAALRGATAAGGFDRGLLPLHNADREQASAEEVLSGAARRGEPTRLARLLRRQPGLRWVGRLHERPVAPGPPPVDREIDAPIVHYGYTDARMAARAKADRNLRLLRRMVDEDPGDAAAWCYLARDAARAGDPDEAARAAERAWPLLIAGARPAPAFTLAALRAELQLGHGDPAAARRTAEAAAGWGLGHPNAWLLAGVAALEAAALAPSGARGPALAAAEGWLRRCLGPDPGEPGDELSAGARSWAASVPLGEALLLRGDPAASSAFEAALAALPPRPSGLGARMALRARLGLAEAAVAIDWRRALTLAEPLLGAGVADGWWIAAAAAARGSRPDDAALLAAGARGPLLRPWRRAR